MAQSLHSINPKADIISSIYALTANISAAKGLMNVLKSNLGPTGTLKMLVGGAGQISITKDGNQLLKQMQIQHPTASLIARTAVAQDDVTGDGTTSVVLLAGEILRQCESKVAEGLHPRVLVEGLELARDETIRFLDTFKTSVINKEKDEKKKDIDTKKTSSKKEEKKEDNNNKKSNKINIDRDVLVNVAKTALRTKLSQELTDHLTDAVVDAVLCVIPKSEDTAFKEVDLNMIEIMIMEHQSEFDTKLIKGLVLDHGARHPNMSKRSTNCYILTANISLEWENTEVNSGIFYSSAEHREKMVKGERIHTNKKVEQIIALKKKVVDNGDKTASFVLVNQKGIDPISLDLLQKNGIIGIRRAKRRNMERIPLACGGYSINTEKALIPDCLGKAGLVYERTLGDDKFTFIEDVKNPFSCTILIRGPNKHTINQVKDAIKDGLRAVKNTILDGSIVLGAGCFEANAYKNLVSYKSKVKGRPKIGVQCFANALLAIPRTLSNNSGHDCQDQLIKLLDATDEDKLVGCDLDSGDLLDPKQSGIYDNYCVKKQFISLAAIISSKLLLVDEIMRAGRSMGKKGV